MGKLIIFEGTDGSGKSTQVQLLCDRLNGSGSVYHRLVFPRYDKDSSALVRMYLNGQFGSHPSDVNAYAASLFFAVDRYASWKEEWEDVYRNGIPIISDRYSTSNAVHQGSKLPESEQDRFFSWLYDLEFRKLGLPAPDLVVFLDVPIDYTEKLMRHREQTAGTHADIHEQDSAYLRTCRITASRAADFFGWKRVSCVKNGEMRSKEDIHEEVWNLVSPLILMP